jgi:hypothetical protein
MSEAVGDPPRRERVGRLLTTVSAMVAIVGSVVASYVAAWSVRDARAQLTVAVAGQVTDQFQNTNLSSAALLGTDLRGLPL